MKMTYQEYEQDKQEYIRLNKNTIFPFAEEQEHPILTDKYVNNGSASDIFFAYPIWAARKILNANPNIHYDICSQFDTFIANLLTFRENLTLYSTKSFPLNIEKEFHITIYSSNNILDELYHIPSSSISSISCLNYLELIGLGRLGEPYLDIDAWIKLLEQLKLILAPKGRLYLSTRIFSKEQIIFNRYREFNYKTILNYCKPLRLREMSVSNGKHIIKCIYENDKGETIINQKQLDRLEHLDQSCIAMFELYKQGD